MGSISEVNLAVSLAIRRLEQHDEELPFLFAEYMKTGLYAPDTLDSVNAEYCGSYNNENLLPESFGDILKKEMERLL